MLPPSGWQHSICPLGHLGYTFRPVCIVGIGPLTTELHQFWADQEQEENESEVIDKTEDEKIESLHSSPSTEDSLSDDKGPHFLLQHYSNEEDGHQSTQTDCVTTTNRRRCAESPKRSPTMKIQAEKTPEKSIQQSAWSMLIQPANNPLDRPVNFSRLEVAKQQSEEDNNETDAS